MPASATEDLFDDGLNFFLNNISHFIPLTGEPTDFTDANTLLSNGGKRLAKRALSTAELTLQNDGAGGREIVIPRKGYLAEESGDVTHLAFIDEGNSVLIAYTEHDDGNGNPVSITIDEGYNIEQTTLGFNDLTPA